MDRRQLLKNTLGAVLASATLVNSGCLSTTAGGEAKNGEAEDGEVDEPTYDVLVGAGQSNAVGKGSSRRSPDVADGVAYEYKRTKGEIVRLDDPVGEHDNAERQADTGSLWPAFAKEYHNKTGRKAIYVNHSRGGSGQSSQARDNPDLLWSEDGNLYYNARDELQEATAFLEKQGQSYTVRGCIWLQGERDASEIDKGNMTEQDYKSALNAHIDRWQADIKSDFRFFIIKVGHEAGGDTQGYQQVRAAQDAVAEQRKHVHIVSDIQKDFPEEGKMIDTWHYGQTALNEVGDVAARNTASALGL